MKLLKPSWVHHDDNSIFSVDIHPDGSRFATGGQGQDSGKIIIWNMGPVIDPSKEDAEKILCQMDHHIACVNVVRWSNNGLFLASGSDDKLVMIWHYAQGGGSYQNLENWKNGHTLRGHSGDVLDLSWSAKDQYLATCSIDNTVIIWNALKFPEIISRLNAHAGMVKGVAWDPTGVYFASQSDDKTLKIWRTLDWSMEKCIDEPFKQCCGNTHVLRLNWSPDGQLLISAHAMNNGAPTAQIIERTNKWNTKLDFVGHRKAVMSVRFFPQILKPSKKDEADSKLYSMCALGSRDRSVSVWLTSYSRPICVVKDLFDNPIMDLSWCKQPFPGLLACSMDGSVAYLQFSYDEIGYPISQKETEEFFMSKYNCDISASVTLKSHSSFNSNNVQQANASAAGAGAKKTAPEAMMKFIENPDILLAQEKKQQEQQKQKTVQIFSENSQLSNGGNTTNSLMALTPSKQHMLTENHKQVERMMANGRRRITPICISKPGEYDTPKPFVSSLSFKGNYASSIGFGSPAEMTSRTATEHSTIIVEKRDENGDIIDISPIKSIVYSKQASMSSNSNQHFTASQKSQQSMDVAPSSSTAAPASDKQLNFSNTHVSKSAQASGSLETTAQVTATTTSSSSTAPKKSEHPVKQTASQAQAVPAKKSGEASKAPLIGDANAKPSTSSAQSTAVAKKQPETASSQASKQPQSSSLNQAAQQQKLASKMQNSKLTPSLPAADVSKTPSSRLVQAQQQQVQAQANKKAPTTPAKESQPTTVATDQTGQAVTPGQSHSHHSHAHHHHSHHAQLQPIYVLEPAEPRNNQFSKIICEKGMNRAEILLEVHNSIPLIESTAGHSSHHNIPDLRVHLLKYVVDSKSKWQIFLTSKICDTAGSSYLVACVCTDSTLHLVKAQNGVQICCPILLDSKAAVLKCNSNYCMCLTTLGSVYVWKYSGHFSKGLALNAPTAFQASSEEFSSNEPTLQTLINRQSCASILRDGTFLRAMLTEQGVPVIYMSDNRSFFYSFQTECWHLVPVLGNVLGDGGSQLLLNSSSSLTAHSSTDSAATDDLCRQPPMGPLKLIQSREKSTSILKTIDTINKSSSAHSKTNQLFNRQDFTLVHLESQVNASLGLSSPKEYKFWLMTYARYLIENDYEDKLTELCDYLLGPLFSMNWTSKILNLNKRDLLKEIVAMIAQNIQLQRIYSYYKQQLASVPSSTNPKTQTLNRLLISSNSFRQPPPASSSTSMAMEVSSSAPAFVTKPPSAPTVIQPSDPKPTVNNDQEMEVVVNEDHLLLAEHSNGCSKSPNITQPLSSLPPSVSQPENHRLLEENMESEDDAGKPPIPTEDPVEGDKPGSDETTTTSMSSSVDLRNQVSAALNEQILDKISQNQQVQDPGTE